MPDGTFGPGTSEPDVIGSLYMGGVRARTVPGGGQLPVPRSKFGCPAVPVRAIARPRLAEVLAQADWRVALVTGGPATGKTVSVAQWFGTLDPVAREWVTLDAGDDRPEGFWLTFVLALERAVPGAFAQAAAAATDVHRLPPEFLSRLLTAWSAVTDPLVIVLDDVHQLRSPEITEGLGFVVEHLPEGSRMLLTSRVNPHLPISRWRGRGWLAELRQRDLALTLPETAELFTALGEQRLTTSDIERLWRRTEGWVAGLRLAAAGLKDRADVPAAVAEFSGRTPVVADLLADELLHRAPKDLSEFLLRTSVADVLDAELCDALSGRSDSAEVLSRMESDLQFVMATGPSRDTWRYHPLLAEMLRSELQTHRSGEAQGLNRRAAEILEARGDVAGAARCLLAAGDTDRAFSIVSGLRQRHRKCVRPRIPGFSPSGLGPHLTSSGSPAGFPPVSRLPAGFSPFARLPLVSRRPAFSGSSPSAAARFRFPFGVPPGSLPLSNLHASAAARRFRRRWSRAARAKVTSPAAILQGPACPVPGPPGSRQRPGDGPAVPGPSRVAHRVSPAVFTTCR